MKKRAFFTLVELLVSFALLATLLSTLFFWYGRIKGGNIELSNTLASFKEERYAQDILDRIVPRTTKLPQNEKAITSFFTDTRPSLVFVFDAGPNIEPLLSGNVLGRLYHERKSRRLCLGIWPLPEKDKAPLTEPCDKIILLEEVNDLSFAFYNPPNHSKLTVDIGAVGTPTPKEGWQNIWHQAYNSLPAMVVITAVKQEGPAQKQRLVHFAFELPHSKQATVNLGEIG